MLNGRSADKSTAFAAALDKFTGIMFLTTNRIASFDEALKSRIQLTLYYPPSDFKSAETIWLVTLQSLRESDPNIEFDQRRLLAFARRSWASEAWTCGEVKWNGREIRNLIFNAVVLARNDAERGQ